MSMAGGALVYGTSASSLARSPATLMVPFPVIVYSHFFSSRAEEF